MPETGFVEVVKRHEAMIRAAVAECIGVLLFCVITFGFYLTESTILSNSILIGFTHAALMQGTLFASGGHINPAITLAFFFIKWISPYPALAYIIGQFIGSVGCIPILRMLWRGNDTLATEETGDHRIEKETTELSDFPPAPTRFNQWQSVRLKSPTTAVQGFWIEFFVAFVIMLVYCTVHDPAKASGKLIGSLVVGLAVTGGHLAAYNFTGGGINPARVFTIAYCDEQYLQYLVYFFGPILGCIVAAVLYKEIMAGAVKEGGRGEAGGDGGQVF